MVTAHDKRDSLSFTNITYFISDRRDHFSKQIVPESPAPLFNFVAITCVIVETIARP